MSRFVFFSLPASPPPAPFPAVHFFRQTHVPARTRETKWGKIGQPHGKRPKKENSCDPDTAQMQPPNDPTSAPTKPPNDLALAPTQPPSGLPGTPLQSSNDPTPAPAPANHLQAPGGQAGDSGLLVSDGSDQEDDGDKWMRRAGETRWAQKVQKKKCLLRATRRNVKP